MKSWFKMIIFVFFTLALGFMWFLFELNIPVSWKEADLIFFEVQEGEGVKEISAHLTEKQLIRSDFVFRTYVWLLQSEEKMKAGEYVFKKTQSSRDIAMDFIRGEKIINERSIKIIEGWTNKEIAEYLEKEGVVSAGDFLKLAETPDTRDFLPNETYDFLQGKPKNAGLEGYLFPDTYRIFKKTQAEDIIKKMLNNFDKKIIPELRTEIQRQGKTLYEVLTLASIVEEEGQTTEDRKKIAGIFWNRLEIGKPLESDATINYVTGKKTTIPNGNDLATESFYNTYKYSGLPPGPISNPGLESILATIYPDTTDNLYFLNTPDGAVIFNTTYEAHLKSRAEYYP